MGGISIPALASLALSGLGTVRAYASDAFSEDPGISDVQFRPPQWSQPALTMITIPAPYAQRVVTSDTPVGSDLQQQNGMYTINTSVVETSPNATPQFLVFDGVARISHSQQARPTRNPIQVGANLTNHILLDTPRITLDILMSDVLPAYAPGQWVGNASKSVACFATLKALQKRRIPLTITTRLETYTNMFIVNVPSDDTVKTRHGLRARVELEGVFVGTIATQTFASARPQTTNSTSLGTTQVTDVPAGVVSQNMLPSTSTGAASSSDLQSQLGTVIGAGNWSSNNTSGLGTQYGGN